MFDNKEDSNEHYYFILLFIKNKTSEIKTYLRKNINFHIFYYYLNELYDIFTKIVDFLKESEIFKDNYNTENDIFNLFLKNLFNNWYNIYKDDIIEKRVNDKISKYVIKNNIFSKLLCFSVD